MPDTLSRNIYRALFSDDQWDLIYAMAGHALDNDDFTPEDVYSIRNKIHALFDYNDWYLFFCWRWCDSSRTGRCHLHWHHTGAMLHSLLQFPPKEMTYKELLAELQKLNEEQLNQDVAIYEPCADEFWQDKVELVFATEECQVLDVDHPIIRF